jgi:hypothetical protein
MLSRMIVVTLGSRQLAQGLGFQARPGIRVDRAGQEEGKSEDRYHLAKEER